MLIPVNTPTSDHRGPVFHCSSHHRPSAASPKVGANILQVVSAIVPSNKMTVERSGGGGASPLGCDVSIYRSNCNASRRSWQHSKVLTPITRPPHINYHKFLAGDILPTYYAKTK